MKASDISFEQTATDPTLGMDLPEGIMESEAALEHGTLDLGDLDVDYTPDTSSEVSYSDKEKCDLVIGKLSDKPELVSMLSKGVTKSKLTLLSHSVGFDVCDEYEGNEVFNVFINAIAQGYLTSDNFRDTVPCSVKVHYVPEAKKDSVHLHNIGGALVYKSTPAIMAFNEEEVSKLSPLYKGKLEAFSSLYKLLTDACYKPMASAATQDKTSILAFDNLTLARKVAASRDWNRSVSIIRKAGCQEARLSKIQLLAKSIKDNK